MSHVTWGYLGVPQVIKDALFNVRPVGTGTAPTPSPQLLSAAVSVAATSEATPMES